MKRSILLPALFALVSCTSEETIDYSSANREGFLAACTQTGADISTDKGSSFGDQVDDPLFTSICRCALRETEKQLSFEEFNALDQRLVESSSAKLPPQMIDIIADCVIGEASL